MVEANDTQRFDTAFGVAMGQQITPLRPTTIRLGLSFGF
jgi:hypothetical protein